MPRAAATAITAAMGQGELLDAGFVLGLVTDGARPLAGVKVTAGSGLDLPVYYPSADLRTVSRTETSASGLFAVAADPALLFLDVAAAKDGHVLTSTRAPLKAGLCSVPVVLQAGVTTRTFVDVAGQVTVVGAGGTATSLELLAPSDVARGVSASPLATSSVADAGFIAPHVEVTDVAQGLVARVSGPGLYPTVSGAVAWASEADADKRGTSSAHLFAVSAALVQRLAEGLGQPNLAATGLVLGVVSDGQVPVAGATVSRTDGQPLVVVYPDPTFTYFDGHSTSASGVFVVAPGQAVALASVTALKAGWSFAPATLLAPVGTAFFAAVVPASAHPAIEVAVSGVVTGVGVSVAAGSSVEVVAPYALVQSTAAPALASGVTSGDGQFSLPTVPVTNVSQGLFARVSGAGLFPTISGVTAWASEADADKVGTTTSHLFGVSSALVQALASATDAGVSSDGLVMGVITDGAAPVAGAIVTRADGQPLSVRYPNSTFTRLDGTATSASGVFLIAPGQSVEQVVITATKAGWAFGSSTLLQVPGACFFAALTPTMAHAPITVEVAGLVTPLGAATAADARVSLVAPYAFLTTPAAPALASGLVSATNTFAITAVPVTNTSTGLLAEVSDDAGTFYPTVSGVAAWASEADADKQGTSAAHVFAVSKTLAGGVALGLARPSLLADGFIMGLVTNGTAPVAGATVTRADGKALVVRYPNATFTAFDGVATSANGIFLIADTAGTSQVAVVASTGSATFGPGVLMPHPGVCAFVALHP